jgi:ABC-2 type transport system ATP-binding protein
MTHAIAVSALSKTYVTGRFPRKQVKALEDLSLEVQQGEIFGLLGPNGAGKTTFVKLLLSLVRPTAGKASILGMDVSNPRIRQRIGFLPENHRFPGHLTGEQVMKLFGGLSGVSGSALAQRTPALLEKTGIAQWSRMKVRRYSKGMMQRLGLAQALINEPDLLFLDEPTDGVDPVGRKEIRDLLMDLRNQGKTIFLNSHLLSEVEMISDRVAILDKGHLLKVGTVDELTVDSSTYQITIEGTLPEPLKTESAARVMTLRQEGNVVIAEIGTPAELNRLIDLLRQHGVLITAIAQKRSTLEESFLNLIKREVSA